MGISTTFYFRFNVWSSFSFFPIPLNLSIREPLSHMWGQNYPVRAGILYTCIVFQTLRSICLLNWTPSQQISPKNNQSKLKILPKEKLFYNKS